MPKFLANGIYLDILIYETSPLRCTTEKTQKPYHWPPGGGWWWFKNDLSSTSFIIQCIWIVHYVTIWLKIFHTAKAVTPSYQCCLVLHEIISIIYSHVCIWFVPILHGEKEKWDLKYDFSTRSLILNQFT